MDNNEIIEQAAKKDANFLPDWDNKELYENGFITGAKWQAERMYSENDLRQAFKDGQNNASFSDMHGFTRDLTEEQWFEQFKKK